MIGDIAPSARQLAESVSSSPVGDERRAVRQLVHQLARESQPEEMHQRQMDGDEEGVVRRVDHLMRQAAPEEAELPRLQLHRVPAHPVFERAAEHVVDLNLRMPVRRRHDAGLLVAHDERVRHPLDLAFRWLPTGA